MDLGLTGRACVVTGASSGIGRATARALAGEGARVLLVARGEEALAGAARECAEAGGEAAALVLDVTAAEAGERMASACQEHFGGVDVLVNNAGTSRVRPLEDLTDEDWQGQWELNVMASLRAMRALAPRMAERGWGRIVNVCSSSGKRPSGSNVAYSVAKAAQLSLSRAFADAYSGRGVLVNAVGGARARLIPPVDGARRAGRSGGGAQGHEPRRGARRCEREDPAGPLRDRR